MKPAPLNLGLIPPRSPLMTRGDAPAHPNHRLGHLLVALAVLALGLCSAAPAQPPEPAPEALELPATPGGQTLAEWFRMTNAGEEDRALDFVGKRFTPEFLRKLPADAMVAFHLQLHGQEGELVPRRLVASSDHELKVLAQGERGQWLEVTLAVEPVPPHGITRLRVVPPADEPQEAEPQDAKPQEAKPQDAKPQEA